ncbi:hypothetical protein Fmac_019933 [Flemingia macrophylla]|uniref:Uncharacterized protein n=1 Tax=Flemingia macrophylla TaxID=520843 RepID=A0ABD1M982_9FABA
MRFGAEAERFIDNQKILMHCRWRKLSSDMMIDAFLPHMLKMQVHIFKAMTPTRPAPPNGLYVKNRSDKQLWNKAAEGELNNCFPEDKTKDTNQSIVPCGLIAWSLFNDTYRFLTNNKDLTIKKKNIAWGSDQRFKFGSKVYPKNFQNRDLIGGARLNESIPVAREKS